MPAEVQHLPKDCTAEQIIAIVEQNGVVVVDQFVSDDWLETFNRHVQTDIANYEPYDYGEPDANEFLGHQTVRLNGLVAKAPNYVDLILDGRLLGVMDHFLKPNCGIYRLNSSEIIEIHGGETKQELHIDDMIWPVHNWAPDKLLQFNVLIAGTDFTKANGATNVVPGSHLWSDPERQPTEDEIAFAEMSAGSAVFIPGKTVHGGGANTNGERRRAIVVSYVLGWLITQENHFLHTDLELARQLPAKARELLGYDLYSYHEDGFFGGPLGYYEYKSPSVLFDPLYKKT